MKTPASTYRLQIRSGFTLADAAKQVPYLAALGVDWLYLSPLLKAEEGSDHGYDVVDPSLLDPERGGEDELAALADAAHAAGLGILVDIVPNHMGVATPTQNPWWWSLLKQGRGSRYAAAFDVDWPAGGGKVLLPVLGSAEDLQQLRVVLSGPSGEAELHYYDHRFPLAAGTYDDAPAQGGTGAGSDDGGGPGSGAGSGSDDGGGWAQRVHGRQHYELVDWRRADYDLNYRRFFAVSSLAGIRVEVPWVFDESHAQILRWVEQGWVDGLRVDHPDGLADPGGYLERLKEASGGAYLLVEKILEPGEQMPADFRCEGTTGYDALAQVDRIFVDPQGEEQLTSLDTSLRGGVECDYAQLIHDTKRAVADGILNSELRRLSRLIPAGTPIGRDTAVDALSELISSFDVYRSYLPFGRAELETATAAARRRRPDLASAVEILLPLLAGENPAAAELSMRFQQTSGMVMAKGVEDCAFYRYTRLTSLTEVGADPAQWSISAADFHRFMAERQAREPLTMNTLSTHDTKRGEDTRARISVLSEVPQQWEELLARLRQLAPLPDGPLENLLWQSIVGAWPLSRDRLMGYARKAAREAGNSTTWTDPDESFEQSLTELVDAVYKQPEIARLIEDFIARTRPYWTANALGAKLVQLTIPGVPDVYQGSELWEQSLTDPDNRREVDFALRQGLLAGLDRGERPAADAEEAKLLVTAAALRLRRAQPELFSGYQPVRAAGPAAGHLIGFDRGGTLTLATRLSARLADAGGWRETAVELPQPATDVLTGRQYPAGRVAVQDILADYPVALLVNRTHEGAR